MTMPLSGQLNMGGTSSPVSVAQELGLSLTATISMNDSNVRTLAGVGGSGTAWSMNALYGKSAYTPALRVDQSTAQSGTTFAVPAGTPSGTVYTYLMVGGGGASTGAASNKAEVSRGGGGGGQVLTGTFTVSSGQVITFTVGAGGAGGTTGAGSAGGGSSIQTSTLNSGVTVTAAGGNPTNATTTTGGSSGSGNSGGTGVSSGAGGGGGQGAAGSNGSAGAGGNGGNGTSTTVGGTAYALGGGGGGGGVGGSGTGGTGGGGDGGNADPCGFADPGVNGSAGTGGGGGGGAKSTSTINLSILGAYGGSGRMIIYG